MLSLCWSTIRQGWGHISPVNRMWTKCFAYQGKKVQAQSPARGSQYSVMMHQIQELFSGDLRALASYFRDWDSLPEQSRWWTKGTGKGFCLSASVFLVSIHPTNAPHLVTYCPGDGQWSCWRPQFHRMQSHSIARMKASEGFKERNRCEMKKKIIWKSWKMRFRKKMHRLHYKMCHNQMSLLNAVTEIECDLWNLKEMYTVFLLTCETACFSTGMPCKYSTPSFSGGNIWQMTETSLGTSHSSIYRQAFGPASNV